MYRRRRNPEDEPQHYYRRNAKKKVKKKSKPLDRVDHGDLPLDDERKWAVDLRTERHVLRDPIARGHHERGPNQDRDIDGNLIFAHGRLETLRVQTDVFNMMCDRLDHMISGDDFHLYPELRIEAVRLLGAITLHAGVLTGLTLDSRGKEIPDEFSYWWMKDKGSHEDTHVAVGGLGVRLTGALDHPGDPRFEAHGARHWENLQKCMLRVIEDCFDAQGYPA
jgi:hypothetical protein